MTTTRKFSEAEKSRMQLIGIGAGLLALPALFIGLSTQAAVHNGYSADAWWLWTLRTVLAALALFVAWVVVRDKPQNNSQDHAQ